MGDFEISPGEWTLNTVNILNVGKIATQLRVDEGVVPHAYQDSLGYWTIGVGHLIDKRKGGGLSDKIITWILYEDIQSKVGELDKKIPWWRELSGDRQDALVNMAFNLGTDGLLGFVKFIAMLKEGEYREASIEMLDSLWAKQVGDRAIRLARVIRG